MHWALVVFFTIVVLFLITMNNAEGMFSRPIHYQNWDNFNVANPFDDRTNPDFQYRYGVVAPTIYV